MLSKASKAVLEMLVNEALAVNEHGGVRNSPWHSLSR